MKATAKYTIHYLAIWPLSFILGITCIIPVIIAAPFHATMMGYDKWFRRRKARLLEKYKVEYYKAPKTNKTILKEIEDETR